MAELLNCPFCDNPDVKVTRVDQWQHASPSSERIQVECGLCKSTGPLIQLPEKAMVRIGREPSLPLSHYENKAIIAWNGNRTIVKTMDRKTLYRHVLWMLKNMPNKEDNPFKWNRWLGFLQGICFMDDLLSIKELKFLNKQGLNSALDLIGKALRREACVVLGCDAISLIGKGERWEDISDDNGS